MKYIYCFLLFFGNLYGLYNGNPAFPELPEQGMFIASDKWYGWKLGYEIDHVFNRRLEVEKKVSSPRRSIKKFKYTLQQGVLTFNMINRIEIDASLGIMDGDLTQHPQKGVKLEFDSSHDLAWGIGGRIILLYWNEFSMGVDAKYLWSNLSIDQFKQNGISRSLRGAELHYREWQFGVAFSYDLGVFTPYLGLVFSTARPHFTDIKSDPNFTFQPKNEKLINREKFSLAGGFSLTKDRLFNINFEGRVIGEYGVSFSADLRF